MPMTRRQGLGLMAAGAMATGAGIKGVTAETAKSATAGVFDVAVIGAGVFGSWTAAKLKAEGLRVALIDCYGVAHARASSGGESRVIRLSYGGDPLYTEMARESLGEWEKLSARAALPILKRVGVLWFSPAGDQYMAKSLAYLEATRTRHQRFDAPGLRERYPQMRFEDGEAGFLEEDTGALMAGRGVQTLVELEGFEVVRAGAEAPRKRRGVFEPAPGVKAARLVYALGPWLPRVFPDLLEGRIRPTRQEVMHFGPAPGDTRFAAPALPVWADFNGGDMVYGLPDFEGQGFKIAFDRHGGEIDPDTEERRVAEASVAEARSYLQRRFPDLAAAPLVHSRVCQYENSSNGDFLIDRHPDFDAVVLVGAGSGHGFKHGPAVGRRAAELLMDPAKAVEPRFALARKGDVAARTVY